MRCTLLLAVALCLASAPLLAAGSDSFSYPDGNLYGQGDWVKGGSTSWIQVVNGTVQVKGGDTGSGDRNIGNIVIAGGMTGKVAVDFQVLGDGIGGQTTWSVCVDDNTQADFMTGNLGRFYGTTNNIRGRIAGTGTVTSLAPNLSGPATWDSARMIIDTYLGTVEFFLNGASIGTLNNGRAGYALGRVSFHKVNSTTAAAAGKSIYFDNISVSAVPEPSSLAALMLGISSLGMAIRRRK